MKGIPWVTMERYRIMSRKQFLLLIIIPHGLYCISNEKWIMDKVDRLASAFKYLDPEGGNPSHETVAALTPADHGRVFP